VTPRKNSFVPLYLAFAALTALLVYTGQPLITDAARFGIVSLQLAGDAKEASTILESWGADGRRAAYINLALDFPYLLVYAGLLSLLCTRAAERSSPRKRAAGYCPGRSVWLAAICDAAENIALLYVLGTAPSAIVTMFAWLAASLKFMLLALVITYLLYAEIRSAYAGLQSN
jgi:hypothetical protein